MSRFRVEDPPLYVTRPSLAPLSEYEQILGGVWARAVLTNDGPLVRRLERELEARMRVGHLLTVTNGTVALQMAIRALNLRGEIITTPFSWVATSTAIAWEGCTPVFSDIDPETFNLDPEGMERAITPKTVAVLPVHVFSAPCPVERIEEVAGRHSLKVIYDAAHANFVEVGGRSVMAWGNVSATSFHATKVFNTGEGGACVTGDATLAERLRRIRYFGYEEWAGVVTDGWNGKMTEIHAGLGLVNLGHIDEWLHTRRARHGLYRRLLDGVGFLRFQRFEPESYNYGYMPVVFDAQRRRQQAEDKLMAHGIFPRRYFYPPLHLSPAFAGATAPMPQTEWLAERILCLPLHPGLREDQVENVCRIVSSL